MKQEKISVQQFIFLLILFEIGSTVLFGLGMRAKQDEWLAILIAMICGLILMWVYTKLFDYYSGHTLIQMIPKIFGKFIGYPLALFYIVVFAYESARVLRDFGEVVVQTILIGTPILLVMAGLILSIVYCLRGGIKIFGYMGEIMFPVALLAIILGWGLIFASQIHDSKQLAPVLESGLQPIWKAVFPFIMVFPFGQALLFMMFFPSVENQNKIRKMGMLAILTSGILLALNMMGLISVFGSQMLKEIDFPLYTAIGMVSIADFIMNLDAFTILMMALGGFIKLGAFMYGAVLGTAQLFNMETYHPLIIPWGIIITALSSIIAANYVDHITYGWEIAVPYLFFPLYVVIPILLLIVAAIRKFHPSK